MLSPILWRDSEPWTGTAKAWRGYNPSEERLSSPALRHALAVLVQGFLSSRGTRQSMPPTAPKHAMHAKPAQWHSAVTCGWHAFADLWARQL